MGGEAQGASAVAPRGWREGWARARQRASALDPTLRGLAWTAAAGLVFSLLNLLMRQLALQMDSFQAQFLRYFCALLVMLPWLLRGGLAAWWPQQVGGQFSRGALHTAGLTLWFLALLQIPLADTTAIGFTTPLEWMAPVVCGLMGKLAHDCLTRSYRVADISSTQSIKFLDLVWAALLGWLAFGDVPSQSTLIGGGVICAATIWIARREATRP